MKRVLLLASLSLALAAIHRRPSLPSQWNESEVLTLPSAPLNFAVVLHDSQDGLTKVKQHALEVSDPRSPRYGQYMTSDEIQRLTRASNEDIAVVTKWLTASLPTEKIQQQGNQFTITCSISEAEALFSTRFSLLTNAATKQSVLRAGDFFLPDDVDGAIASIFGLHGLPLPPRNTVDPSGPASVTPKVLVDTYGVSGVTPKPATKNSQAVAEFQGQTINETDLSAFFKQYVSSYTPGTDDKVSKFVGDPNKELAQTEASLDIQYMMGVSVGIKTEFWLYNNMDFCGDLANWTNKILTTTGAPLVHSVSYGWQGDLSALHCTDDKIQLVDNNFAKLAANGISIIFASGDSGSGYQSGPDISQCKDPSADKAFTGTPTFTFSAPREDTCCIYGTERQAKAWSFIPSSVPSSNSCGETHTDTGYVGKITQNLTVRALDTCCQIATSMSAKGFTYNSNTGQCSLFSSVTKSEKTQGATSGNPPSPGQCLLFDNPGSTKASKGAYSGTLKPTSIKLWPSWPASSPWVTSVGATRFVGQKVGNAEMATDQFGSGGGFSDMFTIDPDAKWQAAVVSDYFKVAPQLPPATSFPKGGRATPDVSALGEGYQVLQNGHVSPVGGTSASTPVFAGLVGLINEARIQAGKPAMGFLNPWIYQNPDAFKDVTAGDNAYGRGPFRIPYGFNCTKGWDPVTGLGTPIFSKMLAAAMN